jgi:TRAP-type C4-dicarboxylate transport system permease small subunit
MSDAGTPEIADATKPNARMAWSDGILETIGVAGFVAMMAATLLQVVTRHLEISLDWTEELARILFLASIMIGIAIAIRRRQHVAVDFYYASVSRRAQAGLSLAFDMATLLLLIVWLRGAWILMGLNAGTTFVTVPWLPVSLLYGVEAFGASLMILFVLADLARSFRTLRAGAASP